MASTQKEHPSSCVCDAQTERKSPRTGIRRIENVTVLNGTLLGETFDKAKLQAMNVGNFVSVRKEMRHFAMSKGETIVQVHGAAPFRAKLVNLSEVQPPDAAPAAAAKPGWSLTPKRMT